MPIIKVGNLNLGGTGKTPHTEYLIRLLKAEYRLAMLSRGYKRESEGFQKSSLESTPSQLGDEAFQIFNKHSDIIVAVDNKRVHGIKELESDVDVVILDDALQHRPLRGGLSILLTEFYRPIYKDYLFPAGSLRDIRKRSEEMDVIVVSKCPPDITKAEELRITEKLKPKARQDVFFTTYKYGEIQHVFGSNGFGSFSIEDRSPIFDNMLLITGIANSYSILQWTQTFAKKVKHIEYPDHHSYDMSDIHKLIKIFDNFAEGENMLLTTEKDAVKLRVMDLPSEFKLLPLYYVPIEVSFLKREEQFKEIINEYVRKNKRDR